MTVKTVVDNVAGVVTSPDDVVIPALLRTARRAYGQAIRQRMADTDFDDMPRNGPFVLGGMANRGGTPGALIRDLGITKQAASQLIDTLVLRGYLEREVNTDDRRRLNIVLTDRGRAAAAAVRAGVEQVDAELAHRISPAQLEGLRAGLVALCDIFEALVTAEASA